MTMKYAPVSRSGPPRWPPVVVGEFVDYYNHHHRHSRIGLHTPADVHYDLTPATAQQRSQTLVAARRRHPTRFGTTTDPKILDFPEAVWINQPPKPEQETAA